MLWLGVLLLALQLGFEPPAAEPEPPEPLGSWTLVPARPPVRPPLLADDPCAPPRWELGLDFLSWYPRRGWLPPVVTTSPPTSLGLIGAPGTMILYGNERIDLRHDRLIGTQATLAWHFDSEGFWAAELRAFFLERDSSNYTIKPQSDLLLARPYVNAVDGSPGAEIFAGPTPTGELLEGSINAYTRIEVFGQELNLRYEAWSDETLTLEAIVGSRFLQMRDRFDVTTSSRTMPDRATLYGVSDHFQTFNKFYGGQVGLRSTWHWHSWLVQMGGAMALGATDQSIRTKGQRLTQTPDLRDDRPLGLLVLPSNSGAARRTIFDLIAELNLKLGYQATDHLRFFVGYSVLAWSRPVRSGNQIDSLNTDQITNPLSPPMRPRLTFRDELFWLQGISAGGELRW